MIFCKFLEEKCIMYLQLQKKRKREKGNLFYPRKKLFVNYFNKQVC